MKQLLFLALIIVVLAAGCNTSDNVVPHQPYSAGDQRGSNAEQTTSSSYNVGVDDELNEVNFSKSGNIVSWDEAVEEFTDNWRFIYEAPGEPAKSAEMVLDDESFCIVGEEKFDCRDLLNKDFNGERVHLQGVLDGDMVYVKRISF